MKKLGDIMVKGFVVSVGRSATVAEACAAMTEKNTGIVAVVEDKRLVGLFSERDVVRRVVHAGRDPKTTLVESVMTKEIVVASPDEGVESGVRKLDGANIRHLPIVAEGRLVSMLSVRDLLRVNVSERDEEIQHLHEYLFHVV